MRALLFLAAGFLPVAAQIPPIPGEPKELLRMTILDISQGTGAEARAGQQYTVHYTGWLRDGKKFDSSKDRNEPLQFVQGRRLVIAGWEAGFEGMRAGGKRRLIVNAIDCPASSHSSQIRRATEWQWGQSRPKK